MIYLICLVWLVMSFIKINYYTDIEKIRKNIIYKLLEDSKSVSKTKVYNKPFK